MFQRPLKDVLNILPRLSATQEVPTEGRVFYLHFFIGNRHWYAAEFDGEDIFFGYASQGDLRNAKREYFTLSGLKGAAAAGDVIDVSTQALMDRFPVIVKWDE